MPKTLVLLFILAPLALGQTLYETDTTEIISRYKVTIDYNDGFIPLKETTAKLLGFHTEKLVLEERNWIDEKGEKQFSLKLRKPDNNKAWFQIFSDTAQYSFVVQPPFRKILGMDTTAIRFLHDLKQHGGDPAFKGMKSKIKIGELTLNATVEPDTSPIKPEIFTTTEPRKYSVRTGDDSGNEFISSKIVVGLFRNYKVYPYAFFDIHEKNIKIFLELKSVQVKILSSPK
jgi:hypothetical protein